ncbi:MAG: neutral/alkaline non-lysosomal ceramidase N-terminal domain-containing protein [Candidatus Latescibacteria bacterium]|nr:neutral/alkaline non-lysosomal ceramidase N-terminal domain-containing protein [Candidatus Latescibacterota bacterium]
MGLQIGVARSDITPPVGVELCGFGIFRERRSTAVLEPLYARAMIIDDGRTRAAIINCDLVGVDIVLTRAIRTRAERELDISADHLMIACTHTHSGPATIPLVGWGERDPAYESRLPDLLMAALSEATARLAPAELAYGQAPVEGIAYNRERKDGSVPDRLDALLVTSHGKPVAFLSHYSCHPVVMCAETTLISGDFVGLATNAVERDYDGVVGFYLQGSSGDINSMSCHKPPDIALKDLHDLSAAFADDLRAALRSAAPIAVNDLRAARRDIVLPQVIPDRAEVLRHIVNADRLLGDTGLPAGPSRNYARFLKETYEHIWTKFDRGELDGMPTEIQAIRMGNLVLAAHPSELFYSFGRAIREATVPLTTFVVGYTNQFVGYIPEPWCYDVTTRHYSYPAHFVPVILGGFRFREDVGEVLSESLLEMIRTV